MELDHELFGCKFRDLKQTSQHGDALQFEPKKEKKMGIAEVVDVGRLALWMTVLISAPLLGIALLVGLLIGIVQAATSINESTLSFIPKVAAVALTLAIVGSWQLSTLVDYTRSIFQRIPVLFT